MAPEGIIHKTGLATTDSNELADHILGVAGVAGLTGAPRFLDSAERAFDRWLLGSVLTGRLRLAAERSTV